MLAPIAIRSSIVVENKLIVFVPDKLFDIFVVHEFQSIAIFVDYIFRLVIDNCFNHRYWRWIER